MKKLAILLFVLFLINKAEQSSIDYEATLVSYWPIWNQDAIDMINGKSMSSSEPLFDQDRFGNSDSALRITNGSNYWLAPPQPYFSAVFTTTSWFKPVTFPAWARIYDFAGSGKNNNVALTYSFLGNGFPAVVLIDNYANYFERYLNTLVLSANTWYHVALVINNLAGAFYLNGVLGFNFALPSPVLSVTRYDSFFGKSYASNDAYADIYLDEVKFFNVALTQQQIQDDMASGMTKSNSFESFSIVINCNQSQISCWTYNQYQVVNESLTVTLTGKCSSGCVGATVTQYQWYIYENTQTIQSHNWSQMNSTQLSYASGLQTANLILNSQFFQMTDAVLIMASLCITQNSNGYTSSFSNSITLLVNRPPKSGACSVTPSTGTIQSTVFSIACSNWTDDSVEIVKYDYYVIQESGVGFMHLGSGGNSSFNSTMPIGQYNNLYQLYVTVEVIDNFNSSTSYQILTPIVVYPNYTDIVGSIDKLLANDTTDSLVRDTSGNNIDLVSLTIESFSNAINYAFSRNELTSQDIEQAKLVYQLFAEKLLSFGPVSAMNDTISISSALVAITSYSELLNRNTALDICNVSYDLSLNFQAVSSSSSMSEINQTSGNLLISVTNALQFLNGNYSIYLSQNQDQQTYELKAAAVATKNVIDEIAKSVGKKLLYNETLTLTAPYAELRIYKSTANMLTSSQTIGESQIYIPNVCAMLNLTTSTCASTGVIQQTFSMTKAIIGTNGNNVFNIVDSQTLGLAYFYDSNMKEIKVSNYTEGIRFWIAKNLNSLPLFEQVDVVNSTRPVNSSNQIKTFGVTLSSANQSLTINLMPSDFSVAYFMLLKYGRMPVVNSTMLIYDLVQVVCPLDLQTEQGSKFYSLFVNISSNKYQDLNIGYGFRELTSTEKATYCSTGHGSLLTTQFPVLDDSFNFTQVLSNSLSQRVYASGCYYLNESTASWSSYGAEVLSDSNITHTHCITNHLTQYAGGLVILPPQIDFASVWANASFTKNLTIYLTVIIISSLYLLLLMWCRYQDRCDEKTRQIYLLEDNHKHDKYFYELIVFTGNRKDAGTQSKVSFVLAGDNAETNERKLIPERETARRVKILHRGSIQSFIMSNPRSLGKELRYIRVWHDNSGSGGNAGWYLKFIIVHDLQTRSKYYFVCEDWLALDKSDGSIDRILPVATKNQKMELTYLMEKQTKQKMSEGHLWFSIWARPSTSPFNRTDRLTCAYVLLCITMLVNIMYYEQAKSSGDTNELVIGPLSVSQTQLVIGVISNLLIFPPSFLLLQIFRKSRRRVTKSVLIKRKLQMLVNKMPDENSTPRTKKSKKKPFSLPWWFKIIGYLLSACFIGISIFFIIVKGISFGDELCRKWLASFLISVATSILFTQPIQVALLSLFFVMLFRKSDDSSDLEQDHLDQGKPFNVVDAPVKNDQNMEQKHTISSETWNEVHLAEMRKKRQLERKAWTQIKRLLVYAVFLTVLFTVAYSKTSSLSFYYQTQLQNLFVANLTLIHRTDQIWSWISKEFLVSISGKTWYNGQLTNLDRYAGDHLSYLVGVVQLRQARVEQSHCSRILGQNVCYFDYGPSNYDHSDYDLAWGEYSASSSANSNVSNAFKYSKAASIDSQPYVGEYTSYLGGGYTYHISPSVNNMSQLLDDLLELETNSWIDERTRAVFVEFTLFNVNLNLFCYCTILFEILPTGSLVSSFEFDPISLYDSESVVFLALDIVYLFIIVFLILKEIKLIIKQKQKYLSNWWSYANWIIIIFSWAAFGMYLNRMYEKYTLMKKLNSNVNQLINFQTINYWNQLMLVFLSFCCFFSTVKALKLISFSRNVTFLAQVFVKSLEELAAFTLIYLILLMGFTQLMYLMVFDRNVQFQSFSSSLMTGFLMLIGKFNVDSFCSDAGATIGPIVYCLFTSIMIMALLNLFITIMSAEFSKIRKEYSEQEPEEPLFWMLYQGRVLPSIKSVLKFRRSNRNQVNRDQVYHNTLTTLDSRVSRLTGFAADNMRANK